MRRLDLHVSALNDAEYDFFTSSIADIALSESESNLPHDDAFYDQLSLSLREARAWFRGRFSRVSAANIDAILKLFSPSLAQSDTLSAGQFFAALRLVLHADSGKEADRALAFVQTHPAEGSTSAPTSTAKPSPPVRRPTDLQTDNSRAYKDGASTRSEDAQSHPPQHPSLTNKPPHANNPFISRSKTFTVRSENEPSVLPPLPPRKPGLSIHSASSSISSVPVPFTAMGTSKSAPAFSPSPSIPVSFNPPRAATHVTSTLMKQSLHASKVAQTMKKAEEQLEKERVLQILKSSNSAASGTTSPRSRSVSPNKTSSIASGSDEAPPLPKRKPKQPSPTASSISFEQVALAETKLHRHNLLDKDGSGPSSPSTSPGKKVLDLPSGPPPMHPDRKGNIHTPVMSPHGHKRAPSFSALQSRPADHESFEIVYGPAMSSASSTQMASERSPTSPTSRVFRSKSLHHPSPPPAPTLPSPLRRVRPESIQVLSGTSPFNDNQRAPRDPSSASESPFSNIQRTLATLQPKLEALQPKLDKARYKAEAGISRRGFVRDGIQKGPEREEEEGLIYRNDDIDWDLASTADSDLNLEDPFNVRERESTDLRSSNSHWGKDDDREQWIGVEKKGITTDGWQPL